MDLANADAEVRMQVSRVTQLGGHSFLDLIPSAVSSLGLKLLVQSGESVLAPSSAITRIALPENSSLKNMRVEYLLPERGNPTIVPPEVDPVLYFDRSLKQFVAVDDSQIVSDALLIARPLFRGADGPKTDDGYAEFELLDYEGPKLNPRMPGVSTESLPAPFQGRSL